ncbi:hypothetical protein EMCRGX_G021814 [Ephydatia muelleri]
MPVNHNVFQNIYKAAGPPKPLTAGIIPYNIQSPRGNMVLYDLAGQPEYYTSHCACIEAISLSSPAIFLSLVDVSLSQKEIGKQLYYWSTMISSVCSECPHPSEVIVVGTHADVVNNESLLSRSKAIEDLAKAIFKKQHFRGFIALDATGRFSDNMKKFIAVLSESNDTVVQQCPVISTDCHILYAFLQQMGPSEQVITISQLLSKLQADETNVLPTETSKMIPLLKILSDKGLILFISNKHSPDESWIVLQKSVLLEKVAGVLFAPKDFGEYRALASNIGLVPIPCITECFPDLDTHMLVQFLSQLKLCHLVDSTLKIVDTSQVLLDLTRGSDNGSCYSLFFPSLINVDKPDSFDPAYFNTKGSFGWLMRTKEEHQFFHNRFLHVLMLTLMNGCGGTEMACNPELTSHNRSCIVWSTGICWNRKDGVTILVDVVEQFRSLYMAISLPGPQCQELTVLQDIQNICNQFCPSVDVKEFVIDPRQVSTLFNKGVMPSSLSCVEISELKDAILNNRSGARDLNGKSVVLAEWTNADADACLAKLIGIENDLIGPKLEDLMNEIGAVIPSKWRDVGVQLGVAPGVLDGIQRQNAEKPRSCQVSFEQVFNEWRLQGSKTTYTWTHIIGILRRPAIGENDLAETLATKFK